MSIEGYKAQESDMNRLWGICGRCKEKGFFRKRIIIKLPVGTVISPSHLCKNCRAIIKSQLEK